MKFSNLLLLLLIIVLAVAAYFALQGEKASTKTFDAEFAPLDTAAVTDILLYNPANNFEELKFSRDGNLWLASQDEQGARPVLPGQVKGMLQQMSMLKADRVVSRNRDKWEEYKVGEKGTRALFMSGSSVLLDLVIGKISIAAGKPVGNSGVPRQEPTSYVRLTDGDAIYSTPLFLEPNFNKSLQSLTDSTGLQR